MIAVDTSAIVAIVFDEAERPALLQVIQRDGKALISTVSVVEAGSSFMAVGANGAL